MDTEEALGILAFAIAMAVLASAALSDWRKREASDAHWAVLGAAGLVLAVALSVQQTGFRWEYVCLAAGTAMILLDVLWDREFNPLAFYSLTALLFIVPLYPNMSDDVMRMWASVPACYLVFVGMYLLGVVRGGADAKCLIALSVMLPVYPRFLGLPLAGIPDGVVSQVFVPSISVLFVAAVLTVPVVAYFAARNAGKGVPLRRMLSGYRMGIAEAEASKVWPLEDIVDGSLESIRVPEDEDMPGIYARLREAGREDVWVTPMLPFLLPMAAATAVVVLVGSPLFLIF
ncbi:MAG: hypothetical protein FWH47_04035 [Methanomassiliicoccaceae archaeon]|nr:hypothetical protein [Methanomassiliicoccaceae archaeon]